MLARYGAESPQLASYILEWSQACAKSSVTGSEDGAPAQARARLAEFCAGVSPLSDVEAANLYKKTARIAFSTKLSEVESAQGVDAALNFAEDYIASAEDPFSMQAGLDYLERIDVLSPPPTLQNAKTRQRMREIYGMARDSYICDAYDGCSASHPLSAKYCLETNCPTLTDYRHQVANHLSRSDLTAFNWYIDAIRSYAR